MISTRSAIFLRSCERKIFNTGYAKQFTSPAVRRFQKKQVGHTKPTIATASGLAHSYAEMDNNTLLTVAALKIQEARIEVLKRNIMSLDLCSYDEATETFKKIAKKNREGMWLAALPYQIGIVAGVTVGLGALPLVFDLPTTLWFNEVYVTTDIPGKEDLETRLEVGAWAWNWMEPPLGTASFVLLALQFSRAQMENLGVRPYTSTLKKRRGKKLASCFPQYDHKIILDFSETDPLM